MFQRRKDSAWETHLNWHYQSEFLQSTNIQVGTVLTRWVCLAHHTQNLQGIVQDSIVHSRGTFDLHIDQ